MILQRGLPAMRRPVFTGERCQTSRTACTSIWTGRSQANGILLRNQTRRLLRKQIRNLFQTRCRYLNCMGFTSSPRKIYLDGRVWAVTLADRKCYCPGDQPSVIGVLCLDDMDARLSERGHVVPIRERPRPSDRGIWIKGR